MSEINPKTPKNISAHVSMYITSILMLSHKQCLNSKGKEDFHCVLFSSLFLADMLYFFLTRVRCRLWILFSMSFLRQKKVMEKLKSWLCLFDLQPVT